MNTKRKHFLRQIEPYKSIVYFLCLLFFFHFSWKLSIDGDTTERYIYLFDKNITPDWFFTACNWLTSAAAWFIRLFPNTDSLIAGYDYLYFPDGMKTNIIWGCTGIKQMFIFCGIMVFYRCLEIRRFTYIRHTHTLAMSVHFPHYNWHKWWYILTGCVILTIYNVIRIGSISLLTRNHPERFDDLHDGIFRYIYYTIIFLLWVIWEEKFVKKQLKKHESRTKTATTS